MLGDHDPHPDYPLVGETLGLWRLTAGLGRGGMGEVYEAAYDYVQILSLRVSGEARSQIRRELEALPREAQARIAGEVLGTPLPHDVRFAIKVCNARSGTSGHRRFLQEADMAQRLGDHPYIVSVHAIHRGSDDLSEFARRFELDRGRHRDAAFLVMDLARRSYDHARLSIGEAVHVVRCIATALDHAHSKGVVHRDLKPENILGDVAHPLLTDFGIAKEMEHTDGLTRTGQIIGTLDYMSPEQATDAKRVDHRGDIYSLGVVLYEFATQGRLPYQHKQDRDSCLAAIRSERDEPLWPSEHAHGFPRSLERIILKAMAWRPEDRYQAMSELITDLDRFTRGEWLAPWGRVRLRSWIRHAVRSHPRIVWGGIAAGLIGVLAAALWWLPRQFDDTRSALDRRLGQLEKAVAAMPAAGHVILLPDDERRRLDELHAALRWPGTYPDLRERLQRIDGDLGRRQRFVAIFGRAGTHDGPELLRNAARAPLAAWSLDPRDGRLIMQDRQVLTFGSFGAGRVYVVCDAGLDQGGDARIEIADAGGNGPRLAVIASQGQLQVTRDGVVLAADAWDGRRLAVAVDVGPDGLRFWSGNPVPRVLPTPILTRGAAAEIRVTLPKGAGLERLGIVPEGPR
jgi:serine/threonine protein kinase